MKKGKGAAQPPHKGIKLLLLCTLKGATVNSLIIRQTVSMR